MSDCKCETGVPTVRVVNHWGIEVRSDRATVGVASTKFLSSAFFEAVAMGVDLALEEHLSTCKGTCAYCECQHEGLAGGFEPGECICARIGGPWISSREHQYIPSHEHELCAPEQRGVVLVGDWTQDQVTKKWEPNEKGSAGFAAIFNEDTVQVAWSRHTFKGDLCSPCFPGQVNLEEPGDWIGYELPPSMYEVVE